MNTVRPISRKAEDGRISTENALKVNMPCDPGSYPVERYQGRVARLGGDVLLYLGAHRQSATRNCGVFSGGG